MMAVTLMRNHPLSPCCKSGIDGGPVIFRCTGCKRDVHASTLNIEVTRS